MSVQKSDFDAQFIAQVVECALKIAWIQRQQEHLQDVLVLTQKFEAEVQELAEAADKWDELPDVCYYAMCLIAQGNSVCLRFFVRDILLPLYPEVTAAQLKAATLAKYQRRASGAPKDIEKDIEAERAAIQAALASLKGQSNG